MAALMDIDFSILKDLLNDQFKGKEKLISPNLHALEMGYQYVAENFQHPLPIRLKAGDKDAPHIQESDHILMNGNTAAALGAIYGGATVAAWYPITPSTSVVDAFSQICRAAADRSRAPARRTLPLSRPKTSWPPWASWSAPAGTARAAFTATSGPGLSLMSRIPGPGVFCRGAGRSDQCAALGPVDRHAHPQPAIGYPGRRLCQPWRYQTGAAVPRHAVRVFRNDRPGLRPGRTAADPGDPDVRPGSGHE